MSTSSRPESEFRSWKRYLEQTRPLIEQIRAEGFTQGEAVVMIELNHLQNLIAESTASSNQLAGAIDKLITAIFSSDSDGEEWRKGS